MRGMKWLSLTATLAGLGAAFACSSSSPPVPDATVQAFCADWATAYCQPTLCEFQVANCQSYQSNVCAQFASQATSAGYRAYNQPAGKACIAAINAAFSPNASTVSAATLQSLSTQCNAAFVGTQAVQQVCTTSFDCQAGLVCGTVPNETPKCGEPTPKQIGDACGDPGDQCPADAYCAFIPNVGPQCTAYAPGATVNQGATCSATTACSGNPFFCAGNCSEPTSGAPSLVCDLYPPVQCVASLSFGRGGADCGGIDGTNPASTVVADAGVQDANPPGDSSIVLADASVNDGSTGDN